VTSNSLSVILSSKIRERLDAVAEREDRSASDVASSVIEAFLDARDARDDAIRKAVAEADKGIFVSQEAVHRWMDSWDTENELPMPEPDIFPADRQR
jgi:predicted transcriptional regulator